ncbi:MAG: diguanylate cyclase [Nitrospirota bacterium]
MDVDFKKERLYVVFNHTSDGIIIIDHERMVIDLNPVAKEMIGWKRGQDKEKIFCDDIFTCYDKIGDDICEMPCPVLEIRNSSKVNNSLEINILKKDGGLLLPAKCLKVPSSKYIVIIIQDIRTKTELKEQLIEEARKDHLTGLYNRQYFEESYNREVRILNKRGGILTAVLIRIDNLKDVNKKFGIEMGNEVLKDIGEIVKTSVRKIDITGRYDGNKLIVLLLDTTSSGSQTLIKRLKQEIGKFNETGRFSTEIRIKMVMKSRDREYEKLLGEIEDAVLMMQ